MILVNGEQSACLSALDRGLHYGDGLFETLRVVNGRPQLWQRHMARLQQGCRRLGLPEPDLSALRRECLQVCAEQGNGVLKILLSRGPGGRGYAPPPDVQLTRVVVSYNAPAYAQNLHTRGVHVRLCQTRLSRQPALAGIKHLNRLEQVLARREWHDAECMEGLMCDTEGFLVEGTMSNVFLVSQGRVLTPDLSHCGVAGVMRSLLLELLEENAIPVQIAQLTVKDLFAADEMFLSNSVIGLWPVHRVDDARFHVGDMSSMAQQLLEHHLNTHEK